MNRDISEALERLGREAAMSGEPDIVRAAALATGGVPVQWDMGGALVVTPLGVVLRYEVEHGTVVSVDDVRWRMAAFVKAARRFPELALLFPVKPPEAVRCEQCDGTGLMFGTIDCGTCMGAGWILGGVG